MKISQKEWQRIFFDKKQLIPAILQEQESGRVLMLGYMNPLALEKTLKTGQAHFFSRKRNRLWRKGETSGHVQEVSEVQLDCDGDALLVKVKPKGPCCHKNYHSCFFRSLSPSGTWQEMEKKIETKTQ